MRFADMERKLGEIDRARAVYTYASQFSDPRVRATIPSLLLHSSIELTTLLELFL